MKHQLPKPRCHVSPTPQQNNVLNCNLSLQCLNFCGTKDTRKPLVKFPIWMPVEVLWGHFCLLPMHGLRHLLRKGYEWKPLKPRTHHVLSHSRFYKENHKFWHILSPRAYRWFCNSKIPLLRPTARDLFFFLPWLDIKIAFWFFFSFAEITRKHPGWNLFTI